MINVPGLMFTTWLLVFSLSHLFFGAFFSIFIFGIIWQYFTLSFLFDVSVKKANELCTLFLHPAPLLNSVITSNTAEWGNSLGFSR